MKTLPDLLTGRWMLIVAPHAANDLMLDMIARLAWRGPLRILDGGDRFKAHIVARTLRRVTIGDSLHFQAALTRILLARAFTCYQLVTLLENTPADPTPTLVLDLLTTFYDESVPLRESQRLLDICIAHLKRLSAQGPLAVSARPPKIPGERFILVERLADAADQALRLETPVSLPPPRLL
jgi:hypothetical protein